MTKARSRPRDRPPAAASSLSSPPSGWPLVRDTVDLDLAVHHHRRLHAGACRRRGAKIGGIDLVEGPEVPGIVQPDSTAHYVLGTVTSLGKNGEKVLNGLVAFGGQTARDDLPLLHGDLPRNVKPSVRLHGARERQRLAAGAGGARPVPGDA